MTSFNIWIILTLTLSSVLYWVLEGVTL
jgi:hypothetical protein